jgi:hypothetical protein
MRDDDAARPDLSNPVLREVREGMAVFDDRGDLIGRVERVYLGAASTEAIESGRGPATAEDPEELGHTWLDDIARGLASDEIPATLRARLLQHGYMRLDAAGLFASDRYVMPDQVARVAEDGVHLRVGRDRLIAA